MIDDRNWPTPESKLISKRLETLKQRFIAKGYDAETAMTKAYSLLSEEEKATWIGFSVEEIRSTNEFYLKLLRLKSEKT